MAKELPVLPSPKQSETPEKEELTYSRVFCTREDSPPLKLLLDFLKSKNQVPLIPKMDPAALEDWDWVHISLGYSRERKPIQLFCVRNRGTYQDVFEGEKTSFFNRITVFDDVEAEIARECISTARFIATTQMVKKDMTDEGYDFNG
ncbi:MAG TPA: hypothetical protein PKM72_11335, partial [Nitrospirales bacterium]|nr:hypothetical protein [Nitrospirales bacterium]